MTKKFLLAAVLCAAGFPVLADTPRANLDTGIKPVNGDTGVKPVKGDTGVKPVNGDAGVKPVNGDSPKTGASAAVRAAADGGVKTGADTGIKPVNGDTGVKPVNGDTGVKPVNGDTGIKPVNGDAPKTVVGASLRAAAIVGVAVDDSCSAPARVLGADPFGPQAVRCLTKPEAAAAVSALRKAAKGHAKSCAPARDAAMAADPFGPESVSCRTDAQIAKMEAVLKAKAATDCAASRALLEADPYAPETLKCFDAKTPHSVTEALKGILAAEKEIADQNVRLRALYATGR